MFVEQRFGLKVIAAFKLVKAVVMIGAGLSALTLLSPKTAHDVHVWLRDLVLDRDRHLVASWADHGLAILDLAGPRLREFSVAAFLYAAVFLAEGIGLAKGRRWAEYLTVFVTVSFLPVELVAVVSRLTWPRAVTVVLNAAVIWYLVERLRKGGTSASS